MGFFIIPHLSLSVGMPQPPVMTQMTPGMQMPPAPQQQDPQAPKQGSNAQALAELISFD